MNDDNFNTCVYSDPNSSAAVGICAFDAALYVERDSLFREARREVILMAVLTPEQLERIIERAADKAASKAIGRLKAAGRISYHLSDSYKKTEQLLYLYPRLPEGNAERIRIEAALAVIKDDEYRGVVESRYFDGLTLSEISDIYDCKYQTISKQRIRLVRILAAELFPEDMAREIARS